MELVKLYTSKKAHGWWKWKFRECSSERLLLNPYNGCEVGCFYCYTRAFPGLFGKAFSEGKVFAWVRFPETLRTQLQRLQFAAPGYLSPVSDPFQPVNSRTRLSEKTLQVLADFGLPAVVSTKRIPSGEALRIMASVPGSALQVSLQTPDENLRKFLAPLGSSVKELLKSLEEATKLGIFTVLRIDPIIPFLTDGQKDLLRLVRLANLAGVRHIISSVLDIPLRIRDFILDALGKWDPSIPRKVAALYTERKGPYLHAKTTYRMEVFGMLLQIAKEQGMTLGLCMEFDLRTFPPRGLNEVFMTAKTCDGANVGVYVRRGNVFEPAPCSNFGNCLRCRSRVCGIGGIPIL